MKHDPKIKWPLFIKLNTKFIWCHWHETWCGVCSRWRNRGAWWDYPALCDWANPPLAYLYYGLFHGICVDYWVSWIMNISGGKLCVVWFEIIALMISVEVITVSYWVHSFYSYWVVCTCLTRWSFTNITIYIATTCKTLAFTCCWVCICQTENL